MDTEDMQDTEAQGALVLDIPVTSTAEEATRLIDEPFRRGFYIHRALEWQGGARVFYVYRAKPEAKAKPDSALTREGRAMQFLRDNREMTAKELAAAFKALGYARSPAWISQKRNEVILADRRASA